MFEALTGKKLTYIRNVDEDVVMTEIDDGLVKDNIFKRFLKSMLQTES